MSKKRISLILAAVLLLSAIVTVSALVVSADSVVAGFKGTDHNAVEITEGSGVLGMRVIVTEPVTGFCFTMPTWSVSGQYSASLSAYEWNTDYKTTMSADPLYTERFEKLSDNATNWLNFDEELPAGEYFFCIEKTDGKVGVWTLSYTDKSTCLGKMLHDGTEYDKDAEMKVKFAGTTPKTPFEQVESMADMYGDTPVYEEIKDDLTDYSQYNLPSSSRYLTSDVMPDTWVFTDELGRKSLTYADVGAPKDDKTLAMFYWTWHTNMSSSTPFNVQEFLDAKAAEGIDISTIIHDYSYEGWPVNSSGVTYEHFWDKPIYGYYRTDDPWVLRRQSEMLANAGVDTIFTDNSNGTFTWRSSYTAVGETWTQAQKDGVVTPKMSFLLPFWDTDCNTEQQRQIYLDMYRDGKFRSLWYWLDGKPMLLGLSSQLNKNNGIEKEISEFFTFRICDPGYQSQTALGHWGWLSMYPQTYYYATRADKRNGVIEQMTVGVAQNHNYKTHELSAMNGENTTDRTYTSKGYDTRENALLYGANFEEQFNYALEINPKIIFVTGWNEWIAGRYDVWQGVENAFPDEYNAQASRDLEPSRGVLRDNYYYQFVNYARKFKGVREIPAASACATVDVNKGIEQWSTIEPYYAAYIGNTGNRDYKGYAGCYYTDFSGRNDIIGSQLARDGENVYILIECADDITSYTDKLWMNVYLDVDPENNGWNTFDYVINKTSPKDDKVAYLEKFTGNGYETDGKAEVSYKVDGRYLQICIAKSALGIAADNYDFTINYSITDNVHDEADAGEQQPDGSVIYTTFSGDILDFYTSGDVAPGGRFKFSYISTAENAGVKVESEETTAEDSTTEIPSDETTVSGESSAEDTTAESSDSGCGSVISTFALIAVISLAGVAIKRKK